MSRRTLFLCFSTGVKKIRMASRVTAKIVFLVTRNTIFAVTREGKGKRLRVENRGEGRGLREDFS